MDVIQQPMLEVAWLDLLAAAGMVLVAIGIVRWQRAGLVTDLLVGALRTVVQLALVGHVLVYVFGLNRWPWVVALLAVMLLVATREAVVRQDRRPRSLYPITGIALLAGSGLTLVYVSVVVVQVDPWYNPRYLIPLFGMIIGNAMNGAALAIERLASEIDTRQAEIEAYLALGADANYASREPVRRALRAALIPTVNSLMVVGLVALPGMMTGQIIAGASPLVAIRYQIVVMFMLASCVTIAACIATLWYRRGFFTAAAQLRLPASTTPV